MALHVQIHFGHYGSMLARRLLQLYAGLILYGFSASLVLLSGLGNLPWDVLNQGLERQTGVGTGFWVDIIGALLLLAWIPLRQKPGLGTVSNVIVLGLVLQAMLVLFDQPHQLGSRLALLIVGIVLNGVATGLYIGARFGPGPRDGLMTGLAVRTGRSLRAVRTVLEIAVLLVGAFLGGTLGLGTLAYALSIGPLAQVFVPLLTVSEPTATRALDGVQRVSVGGAVRWLRAPRA
jgi:uncharacterized membrane protein YczE